METTNFAKYLSDFFAKYLPGERNVSHNTILAYKDTFVQFITFMKDQKEIGAQKLTLEKITKETVVDFLDWLQQSRHCSNATRNNRLAAIRSFFNYLQYENPERMFEWQKIISKRVKQHQKKSINYLTTDGIKLLLEQPDISTSNGRRNLALLALMYDSGARVQEMIDLTPSNIRLDIPNLVKLVGKGRKTRMVPLNEEQIVFLKKYMQENHLLEPHANLYPLFSNTRNDKLTRAGITYILKTYADQARKINPSIIPEKISCHSLRHSKAMHLLQAGVNLVYIRDILGHVSVQTTDVYARADSKQKREALEKVYVEMKPEKSKDKSWEKDSTLLEWLDECRRILSIKLKKAKQGTINYLTVEGIQLLLSQPDLSTKKGIRDLALLALMYDCGARVQEIIDLNPGSIRLTKPYTIKLVGKGNKARIVPLMDQEVVHLKNYMSKNSLSEPHAEMYPLFYNNRRENLTRAGITHILHKYAAMARNHNAAIIPEKISCHSIRHSKAMHLLQAGVNLVYIRDILGHVSVTTTEIYARVDSKQKREAIEKAYVNVVKKEAPVWTNNESLLDWLKSF